MTLKEFKKLVQDYEPTLENYEVDFSCITKELHSPHDHEISVKDIIVQIWLSRDRLP
jgi:hypothetical protein